MESVGNLLKRHRDARQMSLPEVARVTRIPVGTLGSIEADRFEDLPGEVFVKGFLKSFALAVGAAPDEVLARYTSSRRVAIVTPLPVTSPVKAVREGGKRLGVAIALVVLLILFTLALSIVLKPRGHDIPPELSRNVVGLAPDVG